MHIHGPHLAVRALPHEVENEEVCNSGDVLAEGLERSSKLVWHVRHGQSTGNVAKEIARAADRGTGAKVYEDRYRAETTYTDAPLTDQGLIQADEARRCVSSWSERPQLVVCSPLTRAIQTAAVMFQDAFCDGSARMVIRPELREFWADNNENMGRTLADLHACPHLQALESWTTVNLALSPGATADWKDQWDNRWARADGSWQDHVSDGNRLITFSSWLCRQPETKVAVVSHWGTINNILNREPWAQQMKKRPVSEAWCRHSWPEDGLAKQFNMPNCGWIVVALTLSPQSETSVEDSAEEKTRN